VGGSSATFAGDGGGGSVVTACAREDELQWVARSEGSIEGTPPPRRDHEREPRACSSKTHQISLDRWLTRHTYLSLLLHEGVALARGEPSLDSLAAEQVARRR
jgi:hypothetical protein